MKVIALIVFTALAVACMAAVPTEELVRMQAPAAPEEAVEPEVVLAEPLNPALLSQGVRQVRQAYDDINVDIVNENGGGYGGGYGDFGDGGGYQETDINIETDSSY